MILNQQRVNINQVHETESALTQRKSETRY